MTQVMDLRNKLMTAMARLRQSASTTSDITGKFVPDSPHAAKKPELASRINNVWKEPSWHGRPLNIAAMMMEMLTLSESSAVSGRLQRPRCPATASVT
mmetsp:Transcript_70957/g.207947  ORF Transcript_70957/g.207947 Transcript_70957/m.207947 type:complete len:98 (-) Transcript_70957:874-1167(-)